VFFLLYIFVGDPVDSLLGVAIVVLGVPAYFVFRRFAAAPAAA